MKKKFSSKKSAFSLIELSIVLIIIGLLVAGVTGGSALIKNAEMRSVITQSQGYQAGVSAFYAQYNYLPGDYAQAVAGSSVPAIATISAGAGSATSAQNSKIEYLTASVATNLSESVAAWDVLQKANFVEGLALTTQAVTTAPTIATHIPAAKIKAAGWAFDHRYSVGTALGLTGYLSGGANEGAAAAPANQNVLVLTGPISAAVAPATAAGTLVNGATNISTPALTGPDALSLDTKMDDGLANSGKVRGLNSAALTTCYAPSATLNVAYTTTSNSAKVCSLTIDVGPSI